MNDLLSKHIIHIQDVTAKACDISVVDMISHRRDRMFVYPRHLAMWLCRKMLNAPYQQIGAYFGDRDHSTIISAIRNCDQFCERAPGYEGMRSALIEELTKPL